MHRTTVTEQVFPDDEIRRLMRRLVRLVGLLEAARKQAQGAFAPANYEEWMRGFFGDGIAEHLMIPYARKIWTVEPKTMDFGWIGRVRVRFA